MDDPTPFELPDHVYAVYDQGGRHSEALPAACRLAIADELTGLANELEKTRLRWRGDRDHDAVGWRGLGHVIALLRRRADELNPEVEES